MSRIDEALRRAGQRPATPEPLMPGGPDSLEAFPADREAKDEQFTGKETESSELRGEVRASTDLESAGTPEMVGACVEKLVVHEGTSAVSVEQYRRLAATLHHRQTDHGIRVLMVASAQPREGKTLTAVNLALTLSESYRRRVLLVDCDLRQPSLGTLLNVTADRGLADDLKHDHVPALSITTLSPCLSLLPGGAPNPDPMASLTSERMHHVLEHAASIFDWVILDTPPVALLPDAHLLAAMVEAAVLVIGAGSTPFVLVQKAIELIGRERIVGVVLNRVEDGTLADATYPEYGYRLKGRPTPGRWRLSSATGRQRVSPQARPNNQSDEATR
jgi:capsular exopolysaccharide synthesis family protein